MDHYLKYARHCPAMRIDRVYLLAGSENAIKGWRSSVIAIGFVAVLLAVFQFDFTGYDTYLPKEEKIARIGTLPDSFASYFWYPEDYTSEDDRESFVLSDDVDVLYNLAQSGIENVKKGITPNTLYSSQTSMQTDKDSDNYICAAFCFELESGKKVYRNYCVSIMKRLRHSQSSAKKKITARNFSRSSMWRKKTYLLSRFRIFI